ncbi:response regulator [Winogradskyella psychrotolerans]|uniref:response regulator n=1 Tax=Winogradskyella psychrotolerans TaxID=1344585 RepID=UPI001C073AD5|nr:response regulator [Winogradskyella psychrotolerans]MBU2919745.1 response regulator [Winogradskyella psychrotolerans]
MRFLLPSLLLLLLICNVHAQHTNDTNDSILDASDSEITSHIDSIKNVMIADYYEENYSSVILNASEILKIVDQNELPLEVFNIRSYLANSYLHLNDSVKAIEYAQKNNKLSERLKDTTAIIGAKIDLGNIYLAFGSSIESIHSFEQALPLAKNQNNKMALFILNYNIADIHFNQLNDPTGAMPYIDAAEENVGKDFKLGQTGISLLKSHYAFYNKDYDVAADLYQQTIRMAKETNYIDVLKQGYEGYINCLVKKEDYKKAYEIGKIQDSLSLARREEEIEKSAKILTAGLKSAQIQEELENEELRSKLAIEKSEAQKNLLIGSVLVSLLLLGLLLYLLKVIKNRRRLNNELKIKNQEYLEAKLESEKLAEVKTRFLSTMSHELRTPLYGIIGLSTVLNNDKNLKSHKTELQSLKFSADYLLNLVNDVLTLNKMDSNEKNELEAKAFLLKDLLNNIKESLEYITGQTNNNLTIALDSKIPKWIKGDQTKMSQILINLLGNALKFTNNGEVQLVVTLIEKVENNLKLKFEVIDNGQGISEADQKKIFEEFGQLKHQGYFQGSGLGLTIVRKLLFDMGSKIELKSVVGEGSNFYFEITVGQAQKEHANENIEDKISIDRLKNKRVLVVDDNTINLLVTKKTLESHNILVDVATNGQEGLDKIMIMDYDIVLMDVNMPIMDGIEATKKIRELQKPVIVIALTAVTQDEQDDRFKSAQFNDSIVKPYKVNEFLKTLYYNLNKRA